MSEANTQRSAELHCAHSGLSASEMLSEDGSHCELSNVTIRNVRRGDGAFWFTVTFFPFEFFWTEDPEQ